MKVLHVITAFDRGGAENHLAELARHQRRRGDAVSIAYLRGGGWWSGPMRELGVAMHPLGLRFYGDPRPLARLRRVIARGGFDLVHAHLPPAELYTRLALLGRPGRTLPLVISKHNDCPFHRFFGEVRLERWVARRAAAVIAISGAVRRYFLERRIGRPVVAIPYGIDAAPFAAASGAGLRRAWGADESTLVIGFAGRLVAQKDIGTLLEAFALFARSHAAPAKLILAGEGPLAADLRAHAARAGVAERVVWAGFQADMPAVMRAFDVFALTSVFEGFGLVLAEAMAAGRPVVATRVSAIPEVVADNATGLLVPPRQPQAVAAAFARLASPSLRARLGAAGAERVAEHFTLERMFRSTDAVYAGARQPERLR